MRWHLCFWLVVMSLLLVLAWMPKPRVAVAQETPKKYALLVGVNEYDHEKLPTLSFSVKDVTDLREVLQSNGYEVILMTVDEARAKKDESLVPTKANIDKQIKSLLVGGKEGVREIPSKYQKGDTVVIAFSGHGMQFEKKGDAYFCPREARPSKDHVSTLVSLTEIYKQLEDAYAGPKILLVDACRNDPEVDKGIDATDAPPPPRGVAALFSCSAGEKSREHKKIEHGVFMLSVLEGLRGKATNEEGEVTLTRLLEHVQKAVPSKLRELYPDPNDRPKQTPGLHFRGSGIPVLVTTTQELKRPALLDCTKGVSEAEAKKSQKAWATYLKGKGVNVDGTGLRLVDLGGDVEMKLMLIPPGKFEMGSDAEDIKAYIKAMKDGGLDVNEERFENEKPKHAVTISKGLLMGKFEVRQREYKQIMGNNPSWFKDDLDCPVEKVTWFDAVAFCNKLSEKVGLKPCYKLKINEESGGSISEAEVEYLPTGTGFRLPTEAEWEYASRGGTKDAFYFGNVLNGKQANCNGGYPYGTSTKGPRLGKTSKVGAYEGVSPHPFGLCDTVGNVWEWCQDGYEGGFYAKSPVNDPVNDSVQKYPVLRGGSWSYNAHLCRCAVRNYSAPVYRSLDSGFRVVLVLP